MRRTAEPQVVPEPRSTVVAPAPAKQDMQQPPSLPGCFHLLFSISVRYKIAGTLIVVLSLAVVSLGVVTFTRQNSILRHEMKSRARMLVQQLANVGKEGLLTKQEMPVYSTITDIQKRDDVVYAMVMDDEGRVFAHSDFSRKGLGPYRTRPTRRRSRPTASCSRRRSGTTIPFWTPRSRSC